VTVKPVCETRHSASNAHRGTELYLVKAKLRRYLMKHALWSGPGWMKVWRHELLISPLDGASGQCHALAALPQGTKPQFTSDNIDDLHSRSEYCREEQILCPARILVLDSSFLEAVTYSPCWRTKTRPWRKTLLISATVWQLYGSSNLMLTQMHLRDSCLTTGCVGTQLIWRRWRRAKSRPWREYNSDHAASVVS
jgi:hypothetical protein